MIWYRNITHNNKNPLTETLTETLTANNAMNTEYVKNQLLNLLCIFETMDTQRYSKIGRLEFVQVKRYTDAKELLRNLRNDYGKRKDLEKLWMQSIEEDNQNMFSVLNYDYCHYNMMYELLFVTLYKQSKEDYDKCLKDKELKKLWDVSRSYMMSQLLRLKEVQLTIEYYEAEGDDDINQLLDEDYEVCDYHTTKLNAPLVLRTPQVYLPSIAKDKLKEDDKQNGSIYNEIDGIKRLIHYIEEFYTLSSVQLAQSEQAHYNAVSVFRYVLMCHTYPYKQYISIYGKCDNVLAIILEQKRIADHCRYYHEEKDNENLRKINGERLETYEQLVKTRKEEGLLTYESIVIQGLPTGKPQAINKN